jgi:ABC-2 type transport system permease protein
MEVKKNLRFFFKATFCSVMSAMEYRIAFLTNSIFMFINNGVWLVIWSTIFKANNNSLNGIAFESILYLWSIPVIGYGFAYFFFGGVSNINRYIINGSMDSYMLQPKHPLLNILTSECKFSAFGDLAYGIILGLIVTKGNILLFFMLLCLGIFSSVFYISTHIIIRSLAVWFGDTEIIAKKYSDSLLTQFSIYPEQLFGGFLKFLLYTVIPVAYMAYLPVNIMLNFNIYNILLILLVGFIFISLAIYIFNKAMKSYESGNSISMRG